MARTQPDRKLDMRATIRFDLKRDLHQQSQRLFGASARRRRCAEYTLQGDYVARLSALSGRQIAF